MTIYTSTTPLGHVHDKGIYNLLFDDISFDDDHVIFKEFFGSRNSITLGQLKTQVHQFGLGLQQHKNLKPGDVVLLILPNSIAFPLAVFACQFAGLVCAFANPSYTRKELRHVCQLVAPKAIITTSTLLINVSRAQLSWQSCIIMDNDVGAATTFYKKLWVDKEKAKGAKPVNIQDRTATAYLPCSSGTTGLPKAVMITHKNVSYMLATLTSIPGFHEKPRRGIAIAPFFHAMALLNSVHLPIYCRGSSVAILKRFDPGLFCDVVRDEKIAFANLVPPMLNVLMNHPKCKQLKQLDLICVGAAPLDGDLQQRAMDVFQCEIAQGHGMTETTVGTLGMQRNRKLGSTGPPMPGLELRIVDDEGRDVATGERGEMLVRAGNVFKGYYKNPEATRETFTPDGQWLKTGDIAICDKETGDFSIVDRKKELIKYKGFQVAPAELEGILLQNPKIAAAAVVGIYDASQATELPRAYVQLRPDHVKEADTIEKAKQLEEEIAKFVASRTSSAKRLRGGVRFMERVPLNPSGKILRKEIRALAAVEQQEAKKISHAAPQAKL